MRKREPQQPHFYMDIFEPPPPWRTGHSNNNTTSNTANTYHTHSPTHRSPIHHQPSLSEIVYQDYNNTTESHEVYPVYTDRRAHYPEQKQQRHSFIQGNHNNEPSSTVHTISTENNDGYEEYDDVEDDESVNKTVFQRHQSDNVSITNSLFTAIDHLEITDNAGRDENEDDDTSSTENLRHGYLPVAQPKIESESINSLVAKLDVQTSVVWEDYRPQYKTLTQSYDTVKKEIYEEIYSTMEKMQELDLKFNTAKVGFQLEMEKEYLQMSDQLLEQCKDLYKEKEFVHKPNNEKGSDIQVQFPYEKVRLNVGGDIFETSLSTLRRDTRSLLATIFSGRHPILAESSDGSYFIDRDPSHFRLVLNYLRDSRIPPTILQDTKVRQELLQEAKYYCIHGLVNLLQ